MEITQSQSLPQSLCLHIFPPKQSKPQKSSAIKASPKPSQLPLHHRPSKKYKPFKESHVFPESLPLHTKNPHAICRDIQRLARQNKVKEALAVLDYMDQQGFPVNVTTFNTLIAACGRTKSLIEGKQVHVFIRINGLENNEFLRTKLVHMYTSCGSLDDADKVFDESSSRSVYPWNALLRGIVIAGGRRYYDVLDNYLKMRELGIELNVYTFTCLIKSFAGASAFTQGLKAHALLIKKGFIDYDIIRTCLIDMYFKCGRVKLARVLFDEIVDKDVVVWGAMIAGFAHNRLQREALEYVRWMVSEGVNMNSVVLTIVLPVIGDIGARRLGREVHAFVLRRRRFMNERFIQSGLVDMYCKCGDMVSGRRVFYGIAERNETMWTALMSGYVSNGRLEQALRSIVWMQQEGFRPDVVTVATVVPVCAQLKALKQGKEIHAYAIKNWFFPNVSITTSLMLMYSKCGVLQCSIRLFDTMEKRNVISWTAMMDSYIDNHQPLEALDLFRSLLSSKCRPDSVTISRMLSVCSELKALKLGKELHGQILKKKFESVPFVAAETIKMYAMCSCLNTAHMVFNAIPNKGTITRTAIIEAHRCNGQFRAAINLFDEMLNSGFTPNHITFKVVLSVCNQAGFVDEACRIFNVMIRKYDVKAAEEHCSILIELLTRFGRIDEAQRFVKMSSS